MGNEMMNRFLGIALEMVLNRHRRREILFWWLYFFFFFFLVSFLLFLALLYSMEPGNPGGEAQRKLQRRACWKLYSPVYLALYGLQLQTLRSCNYKYFTTRERFLTDHSWERHTTASIAYYLGRIHSSRHGS